MSRYIVVTRDAGCHEVWQENGPGHYDRLIATCPRHTFADHLREMLLAPAIVQHESVQ